MKKVLILIILLSLSILLAACSSNESKESSASDSANSNRDQSVEEEAESSEPGYGAANDTAQQESKAKVEEPSQIDRKIIYTANLRIEVKDFEQTINDIQTRVLDYNGYIVESTMYGDSGDGPTNGQITARIPQGKFREFVQLVEEGSSKVLESSISGQDVTEEYIDLESRLKSKRVVEERLLSFMEQAEKTEDLLAISKDLGVIQEEIEGITGRMKYLQNKSDLATVTIHVWENNVTISNLSEDDLNTWEQTKQQFMESINFLLTAFSSLVVFFIGNLPVLILFGVIGLIIFLIVRKKKNNRIE